jgi:hypothetical protein
MRPRLFRSAGTLLIALTAVACGPPGAATPIATPHVTTFAEYRTAVCASWDALFAAVGNPDTGSGSVLSKSLDQAVLAHDPATAERLATETVSRLETGRQQASLAGRWPSAGPMMSQMDRLFVAFEMETAAKRAAAAQPAGAVDANAAFEQAGGPAAWKAMFEAAAGVARPSEAPAESCPSVPVVP